jgi:hypothetical protein
MRVFVICDTVQSPVPVGTGSRVQYQYVVDACRPLVNPDETRFEPTPIVQVTGLRVHVT